MSPNLPQAIVLICLCGFSLFAQLSAAKDIYVNPNQTNEDYNNCGPISNPCVYISSAIRKSASGDVIILQNGTYIGKDSRSFALEDTVLSFQSENGPSLTTIDLQYSGRLFSVSSSTITLDGITIMHGSVEENGGVIYITHDSVVTINNCFFQNNTANNGGSIYANTSSLIVSQSHFYRNTAYNVGGAISTDSDGGDIRPTVYLSITDSVFARNRAQYGGSLFLYFANATVSESTFSHNSASQQGGSIYGSGFSYLTMSKSVVQNSTSVGYGGAYAARSAFVWFTDTEFKFNIGLNGGAIMGDIGTVTSLYNCSVAHNTALNGAGLYSENARIELTLTDVNSNRAIQHGGGIHLESEARAYVRSSKIENNHANGDGGGVYLQYRCNFQVSDSSITNNIASSDGGGIFCSDSKVNLTSTTLSGNHQGPSGDNADLYCSGYPSMSSCTIYKDSTDGARCGPDVTDDTAGGPLPLLAIIGIALGGGALIITIVMISVCIYWKHKSKKQQKAWKKVPMVNADANELLEDYD